jgi:hypothetical protein
MTMINPGQAVGIGATGVTLNVNGLTANCNAINTGCIRISAMGTSLIMSSSTISNPTGFAIYVDDGNKLQELSITNTDYLCPVPNNQDCNYLMDNTVPTTTIMDYNTYHYPYPGHYGSSMRWNGNWITISGLIGWSNWQALGFDAHSTTTTP